MPLLILLTLLFQRPGFQLSATTGVWLNVLILGSTAGLFENVARYIVLRWGARSARNWNDAVMFGAGHGGIEAMLLVGISVVNSLVLLTLGDIVLVQIRAASPEQAAAVAQQLDALRTLQWWMPILSIWERMIAITLHIALTIIVMRAVTRHEARWLWLAILIHSLFDGTVAALQYYTSNNILLIEAVLTVMALVPIGMLVATYKAARKSSPTAGNVGTPQHA